MSTPQTDSHWEFQRSVYQSFDEMIEKWRTGEVDYDEVEEELQRMVEDEDIQEVTYNKCMKLWEQAKADDEMWQKEDMEKWDAFNKDSGAY